MKLVHIILVTYLIIPSIALGADSKGNHAIWGVGNKSCFSYSNARKDGDVSAYKHYIMGYLTAYNAFVEDTYRISGKMNLNEILVWFDDYCELKAVNAFELALTDFVFEHHEKRTRTPSSGMGR